MCVQLGVLSEEKQSLLELWELRRQQYEQCMDLQLFYRDTEQVDNWMSKQEVPDPPPPPHDHHDTTHKNTFFMLLVGDPWKHTQLTMT